MSDDLDDLLDMPAPSQREQMQARLEDARRRQLARQQPTAGPPKSLDPNDDTPVMDILDSGGMPDAVVFTRPVNITFLAKVLGVEPRRLHNKL